MATPAPLLLELLTEVVKINDLIEIDWNFRAKLRT